MSAPTFASRDERTPRGLEYLHADVMPVDALIDLTQAPYGYAHGNPLQFIDPLGRYWLQDTSDWLAGFGDAITFGGTRAIRDLISYELDYTDLVG